MLVGYDKLEHPFMKQALNKLGVEGKILQHRKTIYDKPKECVNTILNSKKLKVFPQRQGFMLMLNFSKSSLCFILRWFPEVSVL